MRTFFQVGCFVLLLAQAALSADMPSPEQKLALTAEVNVIAQLARAGDLTELAKKIRPAEESGVQRHVASVDDIQRLFSDVDPSEISISVIALRTNGNVALVRLSKPVAIDLDFYIDSNSGKYLLQAIHP